eukprot:gene1441-1782_t
MNNGTFYVGVLNYTNVFTSYNVTAGQLLEIPAGEEQSSNASKFISNPAARLSFEQRALIEQLWKPELALSENLIRNGLKHEVPDARNWARLVEKLSVDGSTVTIVAFGGSVTVGYKQSNTSYPEQFVRWLQDVFPAVNFKLINLARRATAATFAALCLVQNMPEDADLVLVEYSINGYGGQCQCFTAPQTAGYETLLRKIIRKAPNAALLGFASFMWLDKDGKPGVFYETDNIYGINRSAILVDIVHVGDYGATIYAAFLAWALRHQFTRVLLHHKSLESAVAKSWPMPRPLNPEAAQEDWPTFCAESLGLQQFVQENKGWEWVDEGSNACAGCHKYGYLTNKAGSSLTVKVRSDVLQEQDVKAGAKVMLALTFLKSYSDIGKAQVECLSGCRCTAKVFDGKNTRPTSELHTERMEIGAAPECLLKFTILEESTTGGHKFRLASVAVHKADKIMAYAYGPVYDH